jgi:hypothetical protein
LCRHLGDPVRRNQDANVDWGYFCLVTSIDIVPLGVLPARSTSVEVVEFDAEVVVLETQSRQVHLLGALASLVFDSCDGRTTGESLVAEIAEWSTDDVATITAAVAAALAELGRLGLLAGTKPAVPPPCVGCGGTATPAGRRVSRRLRRRPTHHHHAG